MSRQLTALCVYFTHNYLGLLLENLPGKVASTIGITEAFRGLSSKIYSSIWGSFTRNEARIRTPQIQFMGNKCHILVSSHS